eukprot:4446378-Pyramimonas_sp.AAC.1
MRRAAEDNNGYLVQRLARLIVGRKRGPRQRKFAAIPTSTASAAGWCARMKLPSSKGGCSAIEAGVDSVISEVTAEGRE